MARNKRLGLCQGSQAAAERKLAARQPASADEAECKMPEEEHSELQAAQPHQPREQQHIVRGLSSSWQGQQQMHLEPVASSAEWQGSKVLGIR